MSTKIRNSYFSLVSQCSATVRHCSCYTRCSATPFYDIDMANLRCNPPPREQKRLLPFQGCSATVVRHCENTRPKMLHKCSATAVARHPWCSVWATKYFSGIFGVFFRSPALWIRSGPGKPNQRKVSSRTFRRGIPEQKFNVNRACFPTEKHQNSQKWAKFMNFSFWPFLWFGLPGRLLKFVFFWYFRGIFSILCSMEDFGCRGCIFDLFWFWGGSQELCCWPIGSQGKQPKHKVLGRDIRRTSGWISGWTSGWISERTSRPQNFHPVAWSAGK